MKILVIRSNMLVVGVFSDNEKVVLGKDRIDTDKKDFGDLNKTTAKLYNKIRILPGNGVIGNYTFDGDKFVKIQSKI